MNESKKMERLGLYISLLLAFLLIFASCEKDDKDDPQPTPKAEITSLKIVNGGESKTDTYTGTINQDTKTIAFSVSAKTSLDPLKFEGQFSEGAALEHDTYSFKTSLTQNIRVVNGSVSNEYVVTITVEAPILTGADFSKATVYDFSLNPAEFAVHPDFVDASTRSADFDGEHVLIVSRAGGTKPKLLTLDNITTGNVSTPIMLNVTGVAGGTFAISAGRLAQKRIYISNLAVTDTGKFKIYYWASPSSTPEVMYEANAAEMGLDASFTAADSRFGDNLSVDIDAAGNGYIFAVSNTGRTILRLAVTGFNTIAETKIIYSYQSTITNSLYGTVNRIAGSNAYTFSSTSIDKVSMSVVDKDAVETFKTSNNNLPFEAGDVRVFSFNNTRYMVATTGRWASTTTPQTFLVYELPDAASLTEALDLFDASVTPAPVYSYSLNGTGSASAASNTNYVVIGNDLYLFTASTQAGFAVVKVPRK